jgi:hypothetical protein
MEAVATVTALIATTLNAAAAGWGGWCWLRAMPGRSFWVLLRAAQGGAMLLALAAGAVWISGERPEDDLYWLYALLPLLVGVFAEVLRAQSVWTVLEANDLADADALRRRPAAEQERVAFEVAHRELGVMTLAAMVVAFLALRAWTESGGI